MPRAAAAARAAVTRSLVWSRPRQPASRLAAPVCAGLDGLFGRAGVGVPAGGGAAVGQEVGVAA
ncbi:hypothetical protein SALBM135S_06036 [Streptomyces alboniger]